MLERIERHKRPTLTVLIIVCLAAAFWGGSRYPTLNEKALMGGQTNTEDPLTFMAVIQAQEGDPLYRKIAISSINWAAENRKGMTFGFLLGAGFLTLFSLFEKRGTNNTFLNTLIGIGAGAPLGVCVNCAAPVARGLHASGARIETTLAAMFSSPTMNVVVLTMLFSIFPLYLVVVKLAITLTFLVLIIPLLSRTVFRDEAAATYDDSICPIGLPPPPLEETWPEAVRNTAVSYSKNLWYIIKTTLPLMVLAGLLAATAIHIFPLERLSELPVAAFSVLGVGLFGLFLPLPIALDVVISATMLAAGVPMIYVATLLFTLGIYSIYSFSIVWTTLSRKVALTLTVVLLALGVVAGTVSDHIYHRDMNEMLELLEDFE